jgi:hypothetical protein
MQVGFTGTQKGMSTPQYHVVDNLLGDIMEETGIEKVHHGMCGGADLSFHDLCRGKGLYIVGHPGITQSGRVFNRASCDVDEIEPELPFLERNQVIVDQCDLLLATPKEFEEEVRSGTWATVRRARKAHKPLLVISPLGIIIEGGI